MIWLHDGKLYIQTWDSASKLCRIPCIGPHIYRLSQNLCGWLTGHEYSKTEWGYGGGSHADVWCRWCNKMGSIKCSVLADKFENARSVVWGIYGCDIRNIKDKK